MAESLRSLSAGGRFSGCVSPRSDLRDEWCREAGLLLLVPCSDFTDLSVDLDGEADDDFRLDVVLD